MGSLIVKVVVAVPLYLPASERMVKPLPLFTYHLTVSPELEVAAVKVALSEGVPVMLTGWVVTESTVSVAKVVVAVP